MKLKIILFIGLIALGCKDSFGMLSWWGIPQDTAKTVTEAGNALIDISGGQGSTVKDAFDDVIHVLGKAAGDEGQRISRDVVIGVAQGVRTAVGAPIGSTLPQSTVCYVNATLGTQGNDVGDALTELGVNILIPITERVVTSLGGQAGETIPEALGAPQGSTFPQAINLVKNNMKANFYSIGKKALIGGVAVSIAVAAYYLFKQYTHPGSLNKDNLNKSNLVVESSGFTNDFYSRVVNLFKRNQPLKKIVLAPDIANKASEILRHFMHVLKNSRTFPFKSLLLEGPKGTGKTLFVDHLISFSKLDYIKINSSSFINFEDGSESKAINTVFGLLKNHKKQIIVVIEEADILLNRSVYKTRMLDLLKWLKANKHQFMLIVSAENKKLLDPEVLNIIDQNLKFDIPGEKERRQFLMHNIAVLVNQQGKTGCAQIIKSIFSSTKIGEIAKQTEGYSYAKLEALFNDLKIEIVRSNNKFTKELVADVVQANLEHKAALAV